MEKKPIITELTPELAKKIWKGIEKRIYDERVDKDHVLHHLKQLKVQIGKIRSGRNNGYYLEAISDIMQVIDRKIAKINSNTKPTK